MATTTWEWVKGNRGIWQASPPAALTLSGYEDVDGLVCLALPARGRVDLSVAPPDLVMEQAWSLAWTSIPNPEGLKLTKRDGAALRAVAVSWFTEQLLGDLNTDACRARALELYDRWHDDLMSGATCNAQGGHRKPLVA